MPPLRIAFAGTPEFALPALEALAASGHRLVGVLTQPDRPAGRGRSLKASPVKQRALALGLPLAQPQRLSGEADWRSLRDWDAELLVVVAYGLLLPRAVLDLPRLGCLNIHASLLPRWRGAAPIQRAILAGDAETGVTIMQLDAGLDTGPTYAQQAVAIGPDMSGAELQALLAERGAQLLLQVVASLSEGTATARAQPPLGASYAPKLEKREALIDWAATASYIARQVRAFDPWPVAQTLMRGGLLKIWQAQARAASKHPGAVPGSVLGFEDGRLLVACGEGQLAIERLQCAGRRVVGAADFVHAHPIAGLRFG
jgi:methionyl-tRNA formyltransferase